MPQPNMKKEYRAELKLLHRNRRTVLRDAKAVLSAQLFVARSAMKRFERCESVVRRNLERFDKRIAILEGRLS
jgi:hypothetical protein